MELFFIYLFMCSHYFMFLTAECRYKLLSHAHCTVNILVCTPDQCATQRTLDVMLVASATRRQLPTIYWHSPHLS